MADTTKPEKIASDPKTKSSNPETKPADKAPRIDRNGDDAMLLLESAAVLD